MEAIPISLRECDSYLSGVTLLAGCVSSSLRECDCYLSDVALLLDCDSYFSEAIWLLPLLGSPIKWLWFLPLWGSPPGWFFWSAFFCLMSRLWVSRRLYFSSLLSFFGEPSGTNAPLCNLHNGSKQLSEVSYSISVPKTSSCIPHFIRFGPDNISSFQLGSCYFLSPWIIYPVACIVHYQS